MSGLAITRPALSGTESSSITASASAPPLTANGSAAPTANSAAPTGGPTNSLPTISPPTSRLFARSSSGAATSRGIVLWAAVSRTVSPTPSMTAATTTSFHRAARAFLADPT